MNLKTIKRFFLITLGCLLAHVGLAQTSKDSGLSIYFRVNKSVIDLTYMNNRETMGRIVSVFSAENLPYIRSTRIEAYASPEGPIALNERLSWERAEAIKGYILTERPQVLASKVTAEGVGENWQGLRALVEKDPQAPNKEKILAIIDRAMASEQPQSGAVCKKELVGLGAQTWGHIRRNYLPLLRMEALITVFVKPEAPKEVFDRIGASLRGVNGVKVEWADTPQPVLVDTIIEQRIDTVVVTKFNTDTLVVTKIDTVLVKEQMEWMKKPLLAVKTNLLFDLASVLNVEVEIPLGNRWSVAGEWTFPWWIFDNKKADSKRHRVELLQGNVDVKYWLGNRTLHPKLDGWFVGLYGAAGKYDFEYNKKGFQGEINLSAGLTAGYAHRIGRHFFMEYGLSLGVLKTDYREYTTKWGYDKKWHPIYQKSGDYTWIGPTKVKVSFGWIIDYKRRVKGGAR